MAKCKCKQNHIHKSHGEADYCDYIFKKYENGDIQNVEVEKKFLLYDCNNGYVCTHYVDFLITNYDGSKAVYEFKGTPQNSQSFLTWKMKKALFQYNYPNIPYYVEYLKKFNVRRKREDFKN